MKWYKKPPFRTGETRIRKGFLFFPKTIGYEVRWLEFASWEEKYRCPSKPLMKPWYVTRWVHNAYQTGAKP